MVAILQNSIDSKNHIELCLKLCLKGVVYDEARGTPQDLTRAEQGRKRAELYKKWLKEE